MSFEEQIMPRDNYLCILPNPKIVFIILQMFSLTAKAAARKKTKHERKHVDFLVLSGTAFSTSFLIS